MSDSFIELVSKNPILKEASAKNIEKYIPTTATRVCSFKSNQHIISPRDISTHIGIIISGTAFAAPRSASQNAMLRVMGANDMFGISTLYSQSAHFPSTIIAKTDVELLFIEGTSFKALLEADKNAMRAYLSLLSEKIIYLNKKISVLTASSAEKKLAFFICEGERNGEFISPVSMSALASILDVGRASLYRSFDTLSDMGLIERDGKKIIITDKNALLEYIGI